MAQKIMTDELLPARILNRSLRLWPSFFEEDFLPSTEDFSTKGARIFEENNELHVEVPLPGLGLKDIEVSLNKGVLWVKGEAQEEEKDKKRKFYRSSKRSYSYSLTLPTQIEEKQEPEAIYEDGVLKLVFRLAMEGENKKIKVKAGNNKK